MIQLRIIKKVANSIINQASSLKPSKLNQNTTSDIRCRIINGIKITKHTFCIVFISEFTKILKFLPIFYKEDHLQTPTRTHTPYPPEMPSKIGIKGLNYYHLNTGANSQALLGFCISSKKLWGVSISNDSTALCSKSPHIFKYLNTGGSNGYIN